MGVGLVCSYLESQPRGRVLSLQVAAKKLSVPRRGAELFWSLCLLIPSYRISGFENAFSALAPREVRRSDSALVGHTL